MTKLDPLLDMFKRGDFDLVAVGRSIISDPDWPKKIRSGRHDQLIPFTPQHLHAASTGQEYL